MESDPGFVPGNACIFCLGLSTIFCLDCGQRFEGADGFCRTCGNHILAICDKGISHMLQIREEVQEMRAMKLKLQEELEGLLSDLKRKRGLIEETANEWLADITEQWAMIRRTLELHKVLEGLLSDSKRKRGLIEETVSKRLPEITEQQGMIRRGLELQKDLEGLLSDSKRKRGLIKDAARKWLPEITEKWTMITRALKLQKDLEGLLSDSKRKEGSVIEETANEWLAVISSDLSESSEERGMIRRGLELQEKVEGLLSDLKRKRGLIEETANEWLAEITEQGAMIGRALKLLKDLEGLLSDSKRKRGLIEETVSKRLAGSSVPAEIWVRGPLAERAFQKALQTGKVKVYRGRIMLLGQDRAGKTSLKKSLLGLPFDPNQESTVGVEVDRSRCEIEVDEVVNWMPSKRKKRKVSEFEEEIARFIAWYLKNPPLTTTDQREEAHEEPTLLPDVNEPATDAEERREIAEDSKKAAVFEEKLVDKDEVSDVLHLDISSTTLRNNVTAQVVRHLQSHRLEDDIKSKEAIFTLWDFAGEHLYYASHSVFLSGRAVYLLVHNLNKNLLATAEPLVRQGMNDIFLDNPNNETNLDNLLSWLVSVHNIRSNANTNVAHRGTEQSYLRPPVVIVGTNLDQPFEDVKTAEKHIKNRILGKEYAKHVIMPFFAVDNKTENDEGVQRLRDKIMEVLKDEPYMPEEVPLRWFNFERAVDALVAKQIYFMDLNQLLSIIRQVCHIDDEEEVTAMLNFYHDLGVIVKHGRTVVLQAQWLIDLFKQLITVRPHDEADPLYVNYWRELEVNGILRMALVDHVFSKFSKKGLRKQDILDMMELHGLIAKFVNATDENQDERRYFVPTQLRSSPLALCEIKPSECDPCPLVLHFLDGFVPHGLFPRLVSEFIHWCSENGFRNTPQLFNNGARLFIGKQIIFDLILICKKRFIKIVLKRRNAFSSKPLQMNDSNEMAFEVRNFIERTLHGFSCDLCWLSNLQYELSVVCTHCLQSRCSFHRLMSCCQDDCLHLLRVRPGEELICEKNFCDETISPGWEMWFEVPHTQIKEPKKNTSEAVGLDESVSFKLGTLSEDDVLLIAHELGPSWKKVALVLKVPYAEINEIEADETKVFERCHAVLTCWQERFPNDATYHRLARALQHPAVGRVDLAVKYCGLQFGKDAPVA